MDETTKLDQSTKVNASTNVNEITRVNGITKDTKVSDILQEYGDIADIMEVFGVKRVGRYSLRRMLTKALTVERAARVHRVPLDEFLNILNTAVAGQQIQTGQ